MATLILVPALEHIGSGKVRELYRVDDEHLLLVATDRISAFDVVLDQPIPSKGQVLTGLSLDWFSILETPNHLVSADTTEMSFLSSQERSDYAGRAMLVNDAFSSFPEPDQEERFLGSIRVSQRELRPFQGRDGSPATR